MKGIWMALLLAASFGNAYGFKASAWSRDEGSIAFREAGGVYAVEHSGDRDWCINVTASERTECGEIYTMSGKYDGCGANGCALAAVVNDAKGKAISWDWARTEMLTNGVTESTFMVPPGGETIRLRVVGRRKFNGKVSEVKFRKIGGREIRFLSTDEAWKLDNGSVEITVRGGRFDLRDKRSGVVRKSVESEYLLAANWAVKAAERSGNALTLSLYDAEKMRDWQVKYELANGSDELVVTLNGGANGEFDEYGKPGAKNVFPAALETFAGERMIVPLAEGMGYPVDEQYTGCGMLHSFGGGGLCMAFFGAAADCDVNGNGGGGWMTIIETPDDGGVRFRAKDGEMLTAAPAWVAQRGKFGYARRVRYVFLLEGGYVAMAKRYRKYAKDLGLLKTFAEKVKERPMVDRLIGAANVWYWGVKKESRVKLAEEMIAMGIDRILWSHDGPADQIDGLNRLPNVLTSKYDIYQDVYFPEQMEQLGYGRRNGLNGEAWPQDIVWTGDNSNTWKKAWAPKKKDGTLVHCATMCDSAAPKYLRKRLDAELKTKHLTARFIDTSMASRWVECENPSHPMTRTESKKYRQELLRILGDEYKLVVGCEAGHDAGVPYCDYFEGMLSPGPYRVPSSGRDVEVVWTNVPERVEKFMLGEKYRLPLWELVFHDCVCAHWYWGDYSNKLPDLWDKRDLFNVLYGTVGMYLFKPWQWDGLKERMAKSYKATAPIARATGYSEMTDHRMMTADRKVQRTYFANGVRVTVNFGNEGWKDPESGKMLAAGCVETVNLH